MLLKDGSGFVCSVLGLVDFFSLPGACGVGSPDVSVTVAVAALGLAMGPMALLRFG